MLSSHKIYIHNVQLSEKSTFAIPSSALIKSTFAKFSSYKNSHAQSSAQLIKFIFTMLMSHKIHIRKAQLMKLTFIKLSSHKIHVHNAQLS